jgi:hypothetical protein
MFEQLRFANDFLRRFETGYARWAQALCAPFQESLGKNEREERGLKLLREWLSREQLAQYDANNYFDVIGSHTGKRYRIYHGIAANVLEFDNAGRRHAGWCFVPDAHLVAGDVILAQKIALETDEYGALTVARKFL